MKLCINKDIFLVTPPPPPLSRNLRLLYNARALRVLHIQQRLGHVSVSTRRCIFQHRPLSCRVSTKQENTKLFEICSFFLQCFLISLKICLFVSRNMRSQQNKHNIELQPLVKFVTLFRETEINCFIRSQIHIRSIYIYI
jgi:hypothetical protein